MTQKKFTSELLASSHLQDTRPAVTHLPLNLKLTAHDGPLYADPEYYRKIVGK